MSKDAARLRAGASRPISTVLATSAARELSSQRSPCRHRSGSTSSATTAARATSGRKGRAIALRYKVADNLSPKAKAIRIVVRNSRGKRVKTIRPTTRNTARWYSVKWKPKAKGTYRYYVYGKDLAGNAQRRVGSARVVVR